MRAFFALLLFGLSLTCWADAKQDTLFDALDLAIEHRAQFLSEKISRIEQFKINIQRATVQDQYELYLKIYEEYKSFIYDSAFLYANRLQQTAYKTGDQSKIFESKVKLGFVLVSAGLFNEALDTLKSVPSKLLAPSLKSEYFYLMARANYDLCDFSRDHYYSIIYTQKGHHYIDSALLLNSPNSLNYLLFKGLRDVRLRNIDSARYCFEKILSDFKVNDHELAVITSTLSFIYFFTDKQERAKELLVQAALADIRSCTKETLATTNLADMLYKENDIERAYKYIKIALDDANYYGARHRQVQVAAIFPIIEGKYLNTVEYRRKMLFIYSVGLTGLLVLIITFAYIIYQQYQKLKKAEKRISEAYATLTEINHQLLDANKIKEEYIWYYFNTMAEHINKMDALKRSLDMKLMTKKIDDLRFTVNNINIKKEREELYHNFDKVFLKLFPDFVVKFNSFFEEEDRMVMKEDQLLNTELRIFALIRMGIHDSEKIAKILDYSVTTIYTYKTRIRNKSKLPNEEFDRQIMNIRAI